MARASRLPVGLGGFSGAGLLVGGGDEGGHIVGVGTPEQLALNEASHTGRYLRDVLAVGRSNAYGAARN